jgi:hypothetical protein
MSRSAPVTKYTLCPSSGQLTEENDSIMYVHAKVKWLYNVNPKLNNLIKSTCWVIIFKIQENKKHNSKSTFLCFLMNNDLIKNTCWVIIFKIQENKKHNSKSTFLCFLMNIEFPRESSYLEYIL